MSNRIRIEDLIHRELDRSLEMKNSLETKAVGYLTVIALILTILVQLWFEIPKNILDEKIKLVCIVFFITFFGLGVLLLILCAIMLLPRPIDHLRIDDLMNRYEEPSENDDADLLKEMEDCSAVNENTLKILDKLNIFVSRGLMLLLFGFVMASVVLFIARGV
ncbi:MAG: hypothetical protein IJ257_06735 [Treponema sp.]|nr:hypothetical protein [Treponema sp.]